MSSASFHPAKRFAAIVLPELACELARAKSMVDPQQPFGLIVDEGPHTQLPVKSHELLAAVDEQAFRYGARPGQRVSEASAFVGRLQIARLKHQELNAARGLIAELAMGFGTTAALALDQPRRQRPRAPLLGYPLGAGAGPLDTVWLDISGCAQLYGGEAGLCQALSSRIHELGHRCRIAIADGPRLAQAVARWDPSSSLDALTLTVPSGPIVPSEQSAQRLAALPTAALPLSLDQLTWLSKLGVLRVADLARLDRPRLAHRLGPRAQDLLQLLDGHDAVPLFPYRPPGDITERAGFDEPMSSSEPLLFVLRGLIARAIARLDLRGQACRAASMTLRFDPGVVALHNRTHNSPTLEPSQTLRISLPVPLCREQELRRALHAKLERTQLPAPVVEIALTLEQLTDRPGHQIDLGHHGEPEPTALPTLLAELSAWLGPEHVGTLQLVDDHQPERRSRLVPITVERTSRSSRPLSHAPANPSWQLPEPTRILLRPIEIGRLRQGELLATPNTLYTIDALGLLGRIDHAHWWTGKPICRDYARGVLRAPSAPPKAPHDRHSRSTRDSISAEFNDAWVFIDRRNGRGYLHGWFD